MSTVSMTTLNTGLRYEILTGENPSDVELTAKDELETLLKMFNSNGDQASTVVIGTPGSSTLVASISDRLRIGELEPDGFVISPYELAGRDSTVIAARDGRGVLYGCYFLLEKLGMSFLIHPPKVISRRNFVVDHLLGENPDFSVRSVSGVSCSQDDIRWYARNRINRVYLRGDSAAALASEAKRFGIEIGLCGPDFRAKVGNAPRNPETDHLLCPRIEESWDFWRKMIEERLSMYSGFGYYSFRLTDFRPNPIFSKCRACEGMEPHERAIRAIQIANEIAEKVDVRLSVRTWGMDFMPEAYRHGSHQIKYGWDPDVHLREILDRTPECVEYVTKETWGDFMITYPMNRWIGECGPHAQLVEFQVEPAEYRGNDTIPCSMVERWSDIMKRAKARGVQGTWACSWGTTLALSDEEPIGQLINGVNTLAFSRLSWDSGYPIEDIYEEWSAALWGKNGQAMEEIVRLCTKAIEKMLYVLGQRFNSHSGPSETISHVEWCFRHYGFNDLGGRVTRDMLKANEKNLRRILDEKDEGVSLVKKARSVLSELGTGIRRWDEMDSMLREMEKLSRMWREYARAFFLYKMLTRDWTQGNAESLLEACEYMLDLSTRLEDNSRFSRILWRGETCPSLSHVVQAHISSLVSEYRSFLERR